MPTRDRAPIGSPCWTDLWTSDIAGSRAFYCGLFGWEAEEPNPEFGGYFSFTRAGERIAGCMGPMGEMVPSNSWSIYLATDDINATVESAKANGAEVVSPPDSVSDLGSQAMFVDPTGAHFGTWEPGTFGGFTVLNEHGAPSWFELHTREHASAVTFYRTVFNLGTATMSDTDEFRYSTLLASKSKEEVAGIMDASAFLPEGIPANWNVYWEVDNADAAVTKLKALGGSVIVEAEDTPHGRIAHVADPLGAQFRLRTANP